MRDDGPLLDQLLNDSEGLTEDLESKAEYIISEDKHLFDLAAYQGIRIINEHQFEAELDRLGVPK